MYPKGLSPHLRGSPIERRAVERQEGPIPAPAGEPERNWRSKPKYGAYPRTCGGAVRHLPDVLPASGLSPHLRGSLDPHRARPGGCGPIPAPAGEPRRSSRPAFPTWAYPRTCGGAAKVFPTGVPGMGLSPHLRGSHRRVMLDWITVWAYPRTCGGAWRGSDRAHWLAGLSPHLRGSPGAERAPPLGDGPIPAPAGEPPNVRTRPLRIGAYPRTCGGATRLLISSMVKWGLSPHLRGSHERRIEAAVQRGPIPAPAGEPRP